MPRLQRLGIENLDMHKPPTYCGSRTSGLRLLGELALDSVHWAVQNPRCTFDRHRLLRANN